MINQLKNYVLWIYLIIMLGFFPLFYKKQYVNMGDGKYNVFLISSIFCLGCVLCLVIVKYLFNLTKDFSKLFSTPNYTLSLLDMSVLGYFIVVIISFLLSSFKKEALFGAAGWSDKV